jgi:hypothetical protein
MKKKKPESKKVSIEFDEKHLTTLTTALEVYSRLRSGQIKFAMDAAFRDKGLTYEDGEVIESFIRTIVFYKEEDIIKNRNCYYGVGCEAMKDGTVAWEIKKTIEQYLHYQMNNGFRRICDVSGDGPMQISDVPVPKIVDPIRTLSPMRYWEPKMHFRIPQRYQEKMNSYMKEKQFDKVWELVDKSFKKKPLPKGKLTKIDEISGTYYVIVVEPYILD